MASTCTRMSRHLVSCSDRTLRPSPSSYRSRISRPLRISHLRQLSTTPRLHGYRKMTTGLLNVMEDRNGAADRRIERLMRDERPHRSTKAIMRDMGVSGKVPTDLGLLPGTLVMPPWSQRPAIYSQPLAHLKTQGTVVWKRLKDFVAMMTYKFYNGRPFIKLENRKVPGIARDLHRQMYSAFASGDVPELRDVLCRGLFNHYTSRVVSRPQNVRYEWTLERYLGRPRVVSQRATFLPLPATKGRTPALRQAVIRIRSMQSLKAMRRTHNDDWVPEVSEGLADGVARQYDEYVVLQQRIFKGEPEDWRVWGTVTPARWGEVKAVAAQNTPGSLDEPADIKESDGIAGAAA